MIDTPPSSPRARIWTRTLTLQWRSAVSHVRGRIDALERLDEAFEIEAFMAGENRAGVLLGDDGVYEFRLESSSLHVAARTPTPDMDFLMEVVEIGLRGFAFDAYGQRAAFTHLAPLPLDYEAARRSAAEQLMGRATATMGLEDFSLLVDGETMGVPYQAEVGVISSAEMPERVTGRRGRLDPEYHPVPAVTDPEMVPEVGFFMDSRWNMPAGPDVGAGELFQWWTDVAAIADQLVEQLVTLVDDTVDR
ncbi:MAG TPA: hypothetical protein VGA69_01920 [Nitriliruptorales bacterium]